MDNGSFDKLVSLRRNLHKYPEISGNEENTARMVADFINEYHPDEIIEGIGGAGVAFVYHGQQDGDVLMLRAELDALPIGENRQCPHSSETAGVSHKCGHDGHMAILAGLAARLGTRKLAKGKLVLLFQPAEETGEGARLVLDAPKFQQIIPDYVFALHNLPGFPENSVAVKDKHITAASTGMKISLLGRTAHATSPEDGISPVEAVKKIHTQIQDLHHPDRISADFSLITTVGISIGSEDYGVAPANGDMFLTVRAYQDEILEDLLARIAGVARAVALTDGLEMTISFKDTFAASVNEQTCAGLVRKAALANQLRVIALDQCLGCSEDFGRLIDVARKGGALFLLGAGEEKDALHTPDYDFNDKIIPAGVAMFSSLVKEILGFQYPEQSPPVRI